ncbi:hypothetical protein GOV13_01910 [Candidatus Pacearchaeota archaeon]|nr:hypothetical protein [Candidatus Pacearchaeota archaeon]
MKRRGMSAIITSVIIIDIAIVAVGVVWYTVSTVVETQSAEVETASSQFSQSCTSMGYSKIIPDKICDGSVSYMGGEKCCQGELYEDFTAYSETDPNGKVSVSADTITLTDGDQDEVYYVTKDFGTNYFGDFTHWVDINITASENTDCRTIVWGMSNYGSNIVDAIISLSGGIVLNVQGRVAADTEYNFLVAYGIDDSWEDVAESVNIGISTPAYLSIKRDNITVTVEIYSTPLLRISGGAGDDIDTITIEASSTKFSHLHGINTGRLGAGASDRNMSGTISNLALK